MYRMAIQDFFSDEDRERQAAITTSWVTAQQDLASPATAQRIRRALDELPDPTDLTDLTPRQRLAYEARFRSAVSAKETEQDPEIMARLSAVVERLGNEAPVITEPEALWDAARLDEARWA